MQRESASMSGLSFIVPPDHGNSQFGLCFVHRDFGSQIIFMVEKRLHNILASTDAELLKRYNSVFFLLIIHLPSM